MIKADLYQYMPLYDINKRLVASYNSSWILPELSVMAYFLK